MKRLLFAIFFFTFVGTYAQVLQTRVEFSTSNYSVIDLLAKVEAAGSVQFFYSDGWFSEIKVLKEYRGSTLEDMLADIFRGTQISFAEYYGYAVIFVKDPKESIERESIIKRIISDQNKLEKLIFGNSIDFQKNKTVKFSGIIQEAESSSSIPNATISVVDLNTSVSTDAEGKFDIVLPMGEHIVAFKNLNYEDKIVELKIYEDATVTIKLNETPKLLEEVVINDQKLSNINSRSGQINLQLANIKKMPAFLGEVDIIKQIQTLPGVTTVGEISSGFNVRGGGVDQNLILYDGVQIFNNSHVFGFFSSFNAEAIKDASFYKGGIPAEFGGRASSVLNVTSKEGNYKKWEASGGLGIISSNLTLGGPIQKDVSSLSVSFRSSYSDWILKQFASQYKSLQNSSVSFYDASIKYTHKINAKTKLSFSGYSSNDHFGLPSDTSFVWSNLMSSLRLDKIHSERMFSSVTVGYGQYSYSVADADPRTAYKMKYAISYPSLNADLNYQVGKHKLSVGLNSIYYVSQPGTIAASSVESNVKPVNLNSQHSLESALFASEAIDITENIHVDAGLRFSIYNSLGPSKVYTYQSGQPLSNTSRVDSSFYASGQVVKTYYGAEPRVSVRYRLNSNASIKIGYNRIYQYLHLISNTVAVTPIDIWQPSNTYFKPQRADQFSIGYFKDLKEGLYEFSLETYYKTINNVLDFKDGAQLVLNPSLETALIPAHAKSYGIEFLVNKTKGRLSGTFNYTYSRSLRQTSNQYPEETINGGRYYSSNYDQPNVVNLNWKYGISRRFAFTGNFSYKTGRPITIPVSYTTIDNVTINNFSERNQYRVPDYHRLDLAIVMEGNHRRKKAWSGTWILSFYNVYSRKNVYTIFYSKNANGVQVPYQMSIVGTILPSISYKFKF